jgi:putative membrane protein
MKHHTWNSFLTSRRALTASVAVILTGTLPAFAQTGSTGASPTTGASENTRRSAPPAPTPGTEYQSKAAADVDSTTDVNTRRAASPASTSRDKASWGDRRFVTKAADGGHAELQLAELAAQRATNPDVKTFAKNMVDAHGKMNTDLISLASQKAIKLDTDDDKDRAYKRLSKKSGAEFDQEFVEHMIDEHEKAVKMFEKASNDAKDSDVRSFAAKHVGHLREHLQQAQGLRQAVTPTGRLDESSGRSPAIDPSGITPAPSTTNDLPRTNSSTGTRGSTDPVRQPNGTR